MVEDCYEAFYGFVFHWNQFARKLGVAWQHPGWLAGLCRTSDWPGNFLKMVPVFVSRFDQPVSESGHGQGVKMLANRIGSVTQDGAPITIDCHLKIGGFNT